MKDTFPKGSCIVSSDAMPMDRQGIPSIKVTTPTWAGSGKNKLRFLTQAKIAYLQGLVVAHNNSCETVLFQLLASGPTSCDEDADLQALVVKAGYDVLEDYLNSNGSAEESVSLAEKHKPTGLDRVDNFLLGEDTYKVHLVHHFSNASQLAGVKAVRLVAYTDQDWENLQQAAEAATAMDRH